MPTKQLYTKNKELLYPKALALDVSVPSTVYANTKGNVAEDLNDLASRINLLSGEAEEFDSGIHIEVYYVATNLNRESEVLLLTNFSPSFQQPNSENRYAWKKTIFTLSGLPDKIIYEIVGVYPIPYKSDTRYYSSETATVPSADMPKYLKKQDGDLEIDDYNKYIENNRWHKYPVNLGGGTPYLIMMTRETDEDGNWGAFSTPAVISYYNGSQINTES